MEDHRDLIFAEHSPATIDIATDLAIPIIAERGFEGPSLRLVAEGARCSRQAVQQWFQGQPGLRHGVAGRFTARWTRWLDARTQGGRDPEWLLPNSPEVVAWCRVWLALVELGGRDEGVAPLVSHARRYERELVAAAAGRRAPGPVVAGAHAMVEGLRVELCAADPRLDFDAAAPLVVALLARKQGGRHVRRPGTDHSGSDTGTAA